MSYIGQIARRFRHRIAEHRGYIVNMHTSRPAGEHFNKPGHSLSDLAVSVNKWEVVMDSRNKSEEWGEDLVCFDFV